MNTVPVSFLPSLFDIKFPNFSFTFVKEQKWPSSKPKLPSPTWINILNQHLQFEHGALRACDLLLVCAALFGGEWQQQAAPCNVFDVQPPGGRSSARQVLPHEAPRSKEPHVSYCHSHAARRIDDVTHKTVHLSKFYLSRSWCWFSVGDREPPLFSALQHRQVQQFFFTLLLLCVNRESQVLGRWFFQGVTLII